MSLLHSLPLRDSRRSDFLGARWRQRAAGAVNEQPARHSRRNPAHARRQRQHPQPRHKPPSPSSEPAEITEDELKTSSSARSSSCAAAILTTPQLQRARRADRPLAAGLLHALRNPDRQGALTKHKVELEGERYGLHFLGALPSEDPTKAVDRVNITPKKKVVKITIDRELVVKPKEKKEKGKAQAAKSAPKAGSRLQPRQRSNAPIPAVARHRLMNQTADTEAQAEIAAAPPAERPADAKSVTTTTSPAHANKLLRDALGNVFAQGFDTRMMAAMPEFWKLYYAAAAAKTDYQPADPAVLRQNMVDKKARLVSTFEPAVEPVRAGPRRGRHCLYHVVIGADGKPGEIAVARPIGFGLDENAVDAIRKATFEPAIKDGKPVPVLLESGGRVPHLLQPHRRYGKSHPAARASNLAPRPLQRPALANNSRTLPPFDPAQFQRAPSKLRLGGKGFHLRTRTRELDLPRRRLPQAPRDFLPDPKSMRIFRRELRRAWDRFSRLRSPAFPAAHPDRRP